MCRGVGNVKFAPILLSYTYFLNFQVKSLYRTDRRTDKKRNVVCNRTAVE